MLEVLSSMEANAERNCEGSSSSSTIARRYYSHNTYLSRRFLVGGSVLVSTKLQSLSFLHVGLHSIILDLLI